jgi:hypothetical protein
LNSRPVLIFDGDVFEFHSTFIKAKNLLTGKQFFLNMKISSQMGSLTKL